MLGSQADRFAGVVYGMSVPGIVGPPSPEQRAWNRYVREITSAFPNYAALAGSVFPIAHRNAMEAVLRGLEAVDGDLSNGQRHFQAALADVRLDAPNGRIRLDANRQAIAPSYLQRVARGESGRLTMRTYRTLLGVEQTFNGAFAPGAPPLGRETIECRRGRPPAWARR
jgi:branched-chain amino acid transport system substrate-binding protein